MILDLYALYNINTRMLVCRVEMSLRWGNRSSRRKRSTYVRKVVVRTVKSDREHFTASVLDVGISHLGQLFIIVNGGNSSFAKLFTAELYTKVQNVINCRKLKCGQQDQRGITTAHNHQHHYNHHAPATAITGPRLRNMTIGNCTLKWSDTVKKNCFTPAR